MLEITISPDHRSFPKISITIEDCDTLWDIEARYNTGAENKEQYIRSIMQMNHMSSDILYSGQNLIIYYYGQPQTN